MQKILIGTLTAVVAGVAIGLMMSPGTRNDIAGRAKKQWRKLWSKVDLDEDPWAEYNERKAAMANNA